MRTQARQSQVVAVVLLVAAAFAVASLAGASPTTIHVAPIENELSTIPSSGTVTAIACPSPTACVAVGKDANGDPLTFSGAPASWSSADASQLSLGPSLGNGGVLSAISCTATANCSAVGEDDLGGSLFVTGNPSKWTATAARSLTFGPAFKNSVVFSSITCTSSTTCVAVGNDGNGQPVSIDGNPTTWGVGQATEVTLGSTFGAGGQLTSVVCSSSTACIAVGSDKHSQPIVLNGDPSTWTVANATELTLGPSLGNGGTLNSLSCTSSTQCTAAGTTDASGLLTVSGNPSTWTASNATEVPVPLADGSGGSLTAVVCTSSTQCTAVGWSYRDEPLTLTGNPATWGSSVPTETVLGPALGKSGETFALACTSSSTCVAGGLDNNERPFVLSGSPVAWGMRELTLRGSTFGVVQSVSTLTCPSKNDCVAIIQDFTFEPVVLQGNPSAWGAAHPRLLSFPPTLGGGGYLAAASCTSATSCVSVGRDDRSDPMVLTGNPAAWTGAKARALVVGASVGRSGYLEAVSCAAAVACVAVGADGSGEPIVVSGKPGAWTGASVRQLTLPASFNGGSLTAVACTATTACTAVGSDGKGQPIAITGNPAAWSGAKAHQLTLGLAFGKGGSLDSIACPSATACLAVGRDQLFGPIVIEGSPATWTPAHVTHLGIAAAHGTVGGFSSIYRSADGVLTEVRCASATSCVATGSDLDGAPVVVVGSPLALSHGLVVRPDVGPRFAEASFDVLACVSGQCYVAGANRGATGGGRTTYLARI